MFANVSVPDYRAKDEPHALLADLPFAIYLTTNYDDFMYERARPSRSRPAASHLSLVHHGPDGDSRGDKKLFHAGPPVTTGTKATGRSCTTCMVTMARLSRSS